MLWIIFPKLEENGNKQKKKRFYKAGRLKRP